jgi:hypothetical protein
VDSRAGRVEVMPADRGVAQQVGDERVHEPDRFLHAREIVSRLGPELAGVVLDQDMGERVDAAQRRSQIVGNGVVEALELLVELLDLLAAFPALAGVVHQAEDLGHEGHDDHGGGDRGGGGDGLNVSGKPIHGLPDEPGLLEVGEAAGRAEEVEGEQNSVEGDVVAGLVEDVGRVSETET